MNFANSFVAISGRVRAVSRIRRCAPCARFGNLSTWDLLSTEELAMQISIAGVECVPMRLHRRATRIAEALELMRIEAVWEHKDSPTQLAELEPAYRERA